MSWNYRIIYHKAGHDKKNPDLKWEEYLAIHEIFYNDKGVVDGVTKDPVRVYGDEGKGSLISIKDKLEWMTEALQKPILDYESLKEIDKKKQQEFEKSINKENHNDSSISIKEKK